MSADDEIVAPPPARLMRGQVMHERLRPVRHRFVYSVFCVRLDLARLAQASNTWFGVNRRRLMSVRTRDYGARDGSDLQGWVRAQLATVGVQIDGTIWLQTFPRLFGFVFNPVSFFLCHARDGSLRAVLAEVNSTFGETRHYVLSASGGAAIEADTPLQCAKLMHVSPFCEVRGIYRFRFRDSSAHALVAIDYYDRIDPYDAQAAVNGQADSDTSEALEDPLEEPLIRTAIGGHLQALTPAAALAALCAQPLLTLGIVVRIHWQALLLWRKRVPWFGKPSRPTGAVHSSEKEMSS